MLWLLDCNNILMYCKEWHHICAASTKWGIVVFVECSKSLMISLETSCHKWVNCLFVRVLYWVAAPHKVLCLLNYTQKAIIWGPFYGFKRKRLLTMNLMLGNIVTYHMYLLWHGRVWHHRLRHMGRYIWYNNIPLQTSIGNFKSEPILRKFVLYCNKGVLQEDSTVLNISVDISSSQFNFKSYWKFADVHFNDAIEKKVTWMNSWGTNIEFLEFKKGPFYYFTRCSFTVTQILATKIVLVYVDPDLLFISKYAFQAGENCLSTDTAGRSQNEGNRSFFLFI